MATAAADRPRLRLDTHQLLLALMLLVAGNLWVVWLCANVSNVDNLPSKPDGVVTLRRLPENPYRPVIRCAVIGLVYNAIMLTGVGFIVFVNYMEDDRRLRLGLPRDAPEKRIFGKRIWARTNSAHAKAPPRISRQVRPGVRVDLRCHIHPYRMNSRKD